MNFPPDDRVGVNNERMNHEKENIQTDHPQRSR